jgi:MFS family permease
MARRTRRIDLFSPERRFDLLWGGQAISQFGDYLAFFAVPLFVAHLANAAGDASSSELGVWYALDAAPAVVLGLLGGVLIDRVRLRGLMILSEVGRAAVFFMLAAAANPLPDPGSRQGLVLLFGAAFALGTLGTTFNNALYTLVPQLVPARKLASANARLSASQNLAFALGPAAAGLLVLRAGFWLAFLINGLTFVVSIVALVLVGPVPRPSAGERGRIVDDIVNGLRYVWMEPRLRVTTLAAAGANLVIGFIDATLVLTATTVVGASKDQVGLIYSSLGVGAILGSLVAPSVVRLLGLGKTLVVGFVCFGLGLTLFANIPFGILGLGQVMVGWAGLQLLNVPLMTIRQRFTPHVMLGRVLSATRAVGWASLPLGALIGTAVSDGFGLFTQLAQRAPLLVLLIGLSLVPTVVWRNTRDTPAPRVREALP